MSQSEIQALERNIEDAKEILEMGDALERLSKNRDFRAIITHGFFEKEAIRLVHLKADSNMQTEARQKSILAQMDAIGTLAQYFQTVYHKAGIADKAIIADTEMRDSLLAGDLQEGGE